MTVDVIYSSVVNDDRPVQTGAAEESVPFLLGQLGNAVVRGMKSHLKPFGLHPRQSVILFMLDETGGLSQQVISETLSIHRSAMVALIDELEERRLVTRRRSVDDRRAHALHITDEGRAVVTQAKSLMKEYEDEFLAPLSAEQAAHLQDLLKTLSQAHI